MHIDSIRNGIVLDHIKAGKSMEIYKFLGLDSLDCSVAIIKNAPSHKQGRKDIIKIDSAMELDLNILGFIDPEITVNVIVDGKLVEKKKLSLPRQIRNVLKCKNPRCITSVEPDLPQVFQLANRETKTYRCIYCEAKAELIRG
jgi:aspartate carbamoyltransferase regulatory subunit